MNVRSWCVTVALTMSAGLFAACGPESTKPAASPPSKMEPARTPEPPAAQEEPAAPADDAGQPAPAAAGAGQTADTQQVPAGDGELKFNNFCRTCHSVKAGDHRLGPSLHGIIGRKAGSSPGYANYSQAMKSSGIIWDESTLDRFLANPDAVVPGNNMKPFSGVPDPDARAAIIQYLRTAGAE